MVPSMIDDAVLGIDARTKFPRRGGKGGCGRRPFKLK